MTLTQSPLLQKQVKQHHQLEIISYKSKMVQFKKIKPVFYCWHFFYLKVTLEGSFAQYKLHILSSLLIYNLHDTSMNIYVI